MLFESAEALCADPRGRGRLHRDAAPDPRAHARVAARARQARPGREADGAHPRRLPRDDRRRAQAGVQLVVGPSHGFDAADPARARNIDSGAVGRLRMITALNFTDFLYRPRRPEELDTARAAARCSTRRRTRSTSCGGWAAAASAACAPSPALGPGASDRGRVPALLDLRGRRVRGARPIAATRTSTPTNSWAGSARWAARRTRRLWRGARRALARRAGERARRAARNYGGRRRRTPPPVAHEHFGFVVVSCERADLRPLPDRRR